MSILEEVTKNDTHWMTADGNTIAIKDMKNMHIFYTVKKLQREGYVVPDLMMERYNKFKETNPEHFL